MTAILHSMSRTHYTVRGDAFKEAGSKLYFVVAETKAPEQTGQMTLLLNFFDELKRTSVASGK